MEWFSDKAGWLTEWCTQQNAIAGTDVPNWVIVLVTIITMLVIYNTPVGSR